MKILTAHQPAYMPWLGYFHKIALADQFILLDEVQFERNSFTNRNKIKTANGEAWLTIPLEMKGHIGKNILDMTIDEKSDWRKKHWNSLLLSYKKTPFFSQYSDFFESYYKNTTTSVLADFVKVSSDFFFRELSITTEMTTLSQMDVHSKKQELIRDICKKTNSNLFVFGSQGKDYADLDFFKREGIDCFFQEYKHPQYQQIWGEFVPYMCVADCLFNLGAQRTSEIIFENNLTKQELKSRF